MKTKIDLVTGFFGSGKTTFINGYLRYLLESGERVAVIENEFGKPGFDTALLKASNYNVTELSGGCLCCGHKPIFHDLIMELAKNNDRILFEPSGIYTMEDFLDVYNSPQIQEKVEIGSIIGILDMAQTRNLNNSSKSIMMSQMSMAGSIIVSKVDETSDEEEVKKEASRFLNGLLGSNNISIDSTKDSTKNSIKASNKNSNKDRIITKPWSMLDNSDYRSFVNSGYFETDLTILKEAHQYAYQTFTLNPSFENEEDLTDFIEQLFKPESGDVLRLKGFAKAQGETYVINATPRDFGYGVFKNESEVSLELSIIGCGLRRKVINSYFE